MNKKELNKRLQQQIEAETPDIWDSLLKQLPEENRESFVAPQPEIKKKPNGKIYVFASAAILIAAIILLVVTLSHTRPSSLPEQPTEKAVFEQETTWPEPVSHEAVPIAKVTLDVNPSIEMEVDENAIVIGCRPLNKEGEELLTLMNPEGSDVTVASYAVIGAMMTKGYLTEKTNAILLSVTSAETEKGQKIQEELSQKLNLYLEESSVNAAVIGQLVEEDASLATFAKENGISEGKARIIKELALTSDKLTEQSLLKLSTQELLLLWHSKESDTSTSVSYGEISSASYIPEKQAIKEAVAFVQADIATAENVWTEYDCDDGVFTYEVSFTFEGRSYEVEVDARTGKVLEYDVDEIEEYEDAEEVDDDFDDDDFDDDDHYDDEDPDDDDDDDFDDDDDHDDYDDDDYDDDDD